jgi:hypothetical protein
MDITEILILIIISMDIEMLVMRVEDVVMLITLIMVETGITMLEVEM